MDGRILRIGGVPYRIDREIGHGLHSLVYRAVDLKTNRPVAVKIISFGHGAQGVRANTQSRQQTFWKELKMLRYLQSRNPYVIRVFNHDYDSQAGTIVMELGQVFRDTMIYHVMNRKSMPIDMIRHFWAQMVASIYYLHDIGIVHGDCKPENFIHVGKDGQTLHLIDMGISFQLPPDVTSRLKTAAGTPDYVAPEMVSSRIGSSRYSKCGFKSDVWALGVILFEMTFGFRPLRALPDQQSKLRFLARLKRDLPIPKHHDKKLSSVLKGCLRYNPRKRFDIEQVFDHPFLKGAL